MVTREASGHDGDGAQRAAGQHALGAKDVGVVRVGVGDVERATSYGQAAERHVDSEADNEWSGDAQGIARGDPRLDFCGVDVDDAVPEGLPFVERGVLGVLGFLRGGFDGAGGRGAADFSRARGCGCAVCSAAGRIACGLGFGVELVAFYHLNRIIDSRGTGRTGACDFSFRLIAVSFR